VYRVTHIGKYKSVARASSNGRERDHSLMCHTSSKSAAQKPSCPPSLAAFPGASPLSFYSPSLPLLPPCLLVFEFDSAVVPETNRRAFFVENIRNVLNKIFLITSIVNLDSILTNTYKSNLSKTLSQKSLFRVTGLNLLHETKFQRFLSGINVFLNSKFQIREFGAR